MARSIKIYKEQNKTMDLKELANEVHDIAKRKGFWDEKRNFGEMIALIHSELSEALEAHRNNNPPCEKIPEITSIEEEMADTIIRILDLCEGEGINIERAICYKIKYNKNRPHKHGKQY